jgi:hypothetical protein
VRSLMLHQAPEARTQQVQHPATAGERAGLRRPVHPGEDAQIRCYLCNLPHPRLLVEKCTKAHRRIGPIKLCPA